MTKYSYIIRILLILVNSLYITQVQTLARFRRIVSGTSAVEGQFPWHVFYKENETAGLLCGGSIISDTWVLTASHCVFYFESVFLVFGTTDFSNNANNMTSKQIHIHPQYNSTHWYNDIALIELPYPLSFSSTVKPIKIHSDEDHTLIGYKAFVSGFGQISDYGEPNSLTLQWAELEIVELANCSAAYGQDYVKDKNICAKGYGDTYMSTCFGDSGGPLVILHNDCYMQIGVVSFAANDTCMLKDPMTLTKLVSHLDFISEITESSLTLVEENDYACEYEIAYNY